MIFIKRCIFIDDAENDEDEYEFHFHNQAIEWKSSRSHTTGRQRDQRQAIIHIGSTVVFEPLTVRAAPSMPVSFAD